MNKAQIAKYINENVGGPMTRSVAVLDGLLKLISDALVAGDKVSIAGFGIFSKKQRLARTGRNPKTGEAVKIEAHSVVKFKPAKELRDMVR